MRCQSPLFAAHNQTRFGHSAALECRQGHGQLQTFTLLLAERSLLRAVLPVERGNLAKEGRSLQCLQCGAADHTLQAKECAYCEPLAHSGRAASGVGPRWCAMVMY